MGLEAQVTPAKEKMFQRQIASHYFPSFLPSFLPSFFLCFLPSFFPSFLQFPTSYFPTLYTFYLALLVLFTACSFQIRDSMPGTRMSCAWYTRDQLSPCDLKLPMNNNFGFAETGLRFLTVGWRTVDGTLSPVGR
jgi:hypothetical protein